MTQDRTGRDEAARRHEAPAAASPGQEEKDRRAGDRGATSVEYALMASLVAAVVVGVVTALGIAVFGLFDSAAGTF